MFILPQNPQAYLIILLPLIIAAILPQKISAEETLGHIQDLSNKKIYFGHQSVGYNIIAGMQDILPQHPDIKLNIIDLKNNQSPSFSAPIFAHSAIGANQNPKSKIDAFVALMDKGMAQNVGIAFFKFCYVDIHQGTNIKNLFTYYKDAMKKLTEKYPQTTFAHVTAPLTSRQTGIKAAIKKIMGKPLRGDNNKTRTEFNEMMRKEYAGKAPIFDLALIESTPPDGKGQNSQTLLPEYTEDGGHLNNLGSKTAAKQLLIFLATITKPLAPLREPTKKP